MSILPAGAGADSGDGAFTGGCASSSSSEPNRSSAACALGCAGSSSSSSNRSLMAGLVRKRVRTAGNSEGSGWRQRRR